MYSNQLLNTSTFNWKSISMITIDVIFSFDEVSVVELYLIETIDIQGVKERNICIF